MAFAEHKTGFEIIRLEQKIERLKKEMGPEITATVEWGSTQLEKAVDKNLAGDSYYIGKLPVRAITGTLRRAYLVHRVSPFLMYHYFDAEIAYYAKYVHYGTKHLKPRPFFKAAIDERKPAITNYWNRQILKKMRSIGRA